jgi:hypothetical protein
MKFEHLEAYRLIVLRAEAGGLPRQVTEVTAC